MSRSCKSKCWQGRTDLFSPSHICVSSGFEIFKLAMFQYKEDKKIRAKVKLTVLFKNTPPNATNLQTHKTDRNQTITNQKPSPFVS